MVNIEFLEIDMFENISNLSKIIGTEIYQEKCHNYLIIDSKYGSGIIAASKITDTITNLSFDVMFNDDVELSFFTNKLHYVDFIYCLEGTIAHKFNYAPGYERINFRQNAIISRGNNSKSIIKFPGNVPLRVNVITYQNVVSSIDVNEFKINQLQDRALVKLSHTFSQDNYRYLGRICFKTAVYAQQALKHMLESSSEILFKEAAILNTLASQLERHREDTESNYSEAPIRPSEIDKIIALEIFMNNNISEDLTVERLVALSGLNAAKLQMGFKYLFNTTVSCYVREKRLDKAVNLIKETEFNVSELVYSVGFTSRSYFTKIFKERYGVLPSQCITNPNLLMAV